MTNRRGTNIQGRMLRYFITRQGQLMHLPEIMTALDETDERRVLSAVTRLRAREELGKLEIVVKGMTYRFYPTPQTLLADATMPPNVVEVTTECPDPKAPAEPGLLCASGDPECDCLVPVGGTRPEPAHARGDDDDALMARARRRTEAAPPGFTEEAPRGAFAHTQRLFQEIGVGRITEENKESLILKCEDGTVWRATQL